MEKNSSLVEQTKLSYGPEGETSSIFLLGNRSRRMTAISRMKEASSVCLLEGLLNQTFQPFRGIEGYG